MPTKTFFRFLLLILSREKGKHIGVVIIATVMIFLLSSVLFISDSIQMSLTRLLVPQPDFVVTRTQGGRAVNTPTEWIAPIASIEGVSSITPRIVGRYSYYPKEESFLIIGIDFFDEQSNQLLGKLVSDVDLKTLYGGDGIIVSQGVKRFLEERYYKESFSFKLPNGTFKKMKILSTLAPSTNLIASDMVITSMESARMILGMGEDEVSDISFNAPNTAEWDTITAKLYLLSYDLAVTDKRDITKATTNLYNYKGGIFLILTIIVLATFMMILYQRYSLVFRSERRDIAILRAIGWSIADVLWLKFYEAMAIIMGSFVSGVVLGYGYVFWLDAPLLGQIFLNMGNIPFDISFVPIVDLGTLASIFLFFGVGFLASVLIPAWRVAITSPKEAMG